MSSFLLQYTVGCRCWGDSVPAYGLLCKVKFSVWTWVSDWTGCCCFFQCLRSISERYWCWASAPTITLKETTHPCCHNSRWRWSALSSSAIYVVTLSISSGYFAAVFSPALYRFWLHNYSSAVYLFPFGHILCSLWHLHGKFRYILYILWNLALSFNSSLSVFSCHGCI